MTLSFHRVLLSLLPLVLPAAVLAQEQPEKLTNNGLPGTFTGNVGFVSDYTFRGISQTREKPALQGGIDFKHDSGAYVGVWGSSVDFNDTDRASLEIDGYAGYSQQLTDQLSGDVRFIYYAYPGAKSNLDYDYYELYGALTYNFGIPKITASVNYSPDYFAGSGQGVYTALSAEYPLVYGFGLSGHVGRQFIDDRVRFGTPSYNEWAAGVGYDWRGFNVKLQYVDTDLKTTECADGCDAKGVLSVTYAF